MSFTIIVSDFEELAGSPREHGGYKNSSYGVRMFKCAWSERAALTYALMGMWNNGSLLIPPAPFPNNPNLIATEFDTEPFEGTLPLPGVSSSSLLTTTNNYQYCKLTVKYTMDWNNSSAPNKPQGTILDFSSEVSGEILTLPGSYLFWDDSQTIPMEADVNAGLPMGIEDFELTWGRVPTPNWARIESMKDTVNTNAFLNTPPGCLLFKGAKRHRVFQLGQTELWTIGLQFKARSEEWNKFWRRGSGADDTGFQYAYDSHGEKIFSSADHSQLTQF